MRSCILSGVGGVISAAHRDLDTGKLHGHTWEVIAWFNKSRDARRRMSDLNATISVLDHSELPDYLSWGEALAQWIGEAMPEDCVQVDVNRPAERIYARWMRPAVKQTKVTWSSAESSRAFVLRSVGYTYKEISKEMVGRTPQAIKRHLQKIA